jgi:hypothetical protein
MASAIRYQSSGGRIFGLRTRGGVSVEGLAVKVGVHHHPEKIAYTTKENAIDDRRTSTTDAGNWVTGGSDGGSGRGSDAQTDGSRVVHQVNRLDVFAPASRWSASYEAHIFAGQRVVSCSQELAVTESAPLVELNSKFGSRGKVFNRLPVSCLGLRECDRQKHFRYYERFFCGSSFDPRENWWLRVRNSYQF